MMKVTSVQSIRDIESAVDGSIMSYDQMMQNAGHSSGEYLKSRLSITAETRITLLIGKGNNGGDGLVIAHYLAQYTPAQIRLYMLSERPNTDENYQKIIDDELFIAIEENDTDSRLLKSMIQSADIIIDALFGIGIRLPIRHTPSKVLRTVNQVLNQDGTLDYGDIITLDPTQANQFQATPKPFIFAIDCPSGIDCDTGDADPNTILADETISFIAAKHGLFTFPAAKYIGKLILSQIGIPDTQPDLTKIQHSIIDSHTVKQKLAPRPVDGHKGTFGKTFIVAGSNNYIGATALASESAYRSGVGLVTVASTSQVIEIVANRLREPTFIHLPSTDGAINETASDVVYEASQNYNAMLLGCGLGQQPSTINFVKRLLSNKNLPPLIIDADALNILSQTDNWWENLPKDTIITPHPGEMARLTNQSTTEINQHRWDIAQAKAKEWDLVVVLKGAHTLIASPNGEVSVVPFKTDALGTAGTGDILAGLIVGMRTQGLSAYDSAIVATYLHALCGVMAEGSIGSSRAVIAGDIIDMIGKAFHQIESD